MWQTKGARVDSRCSPPSLPPTAPRAGAEPRRVTTRDRGKPERDGDGLFRVVRFLIRSEVCALAPRCHLSVGPVGRLATAGDVVRDKQPPRKLLGVPRGPAGPPFPQSGAHFKRRGVSQPIRERTKQQQERGAVRRDEGKASFVTCGPGRVCVYLIQTDQPACHLWP